MNRKYFCFTVIMFRVIYLLCNYSDWVNTACSFDSSLIQWKQVTLIRYWTVALSLNFYSYFRLGNMQIGKTFKPKLFQIFSLLIFLICLFGTYFYVRARKNYTLSSDDSCSLILGEILASENKLMTKSWYYSTEIRVLGTNVFYSLFFRLTDSWHRVRMLSLISMYFLLAISALY